MPNVYDVGDLIKVSGVFTDEDDEDIDPTTVTFKFTDPSGNTTTYLYGTDDELVWDSKGHYHVNVSIDESGTWYYRWASTGTGQAAEEGSFVVRPTRIAPVA